MGADAMLSISPYYNKPTQKGIIKHYEAIAEAVDIPIIVYNVPGRTGSNIAPATVKRLADDTRHRGREGGIRQHRPDHADTGGRPEGLRCDVRRRCHDRSR